MSLDNNIKKPIIYRINENNDIVFVNEEWTHFASANNGAHLFPTQILYKNLLDFISDITTRHLYESIIARVRAGCPVSFSFRCDSPTCRRLMEMKVTLCPEGLVEFESSLIQAEERTEVVLPYSSSSSEEAFLRQCGWCNRIDVAGQWVEIEEALKPLGVFENATLPSLTHSICEACFLAMKATLKNL